MPSNELKDFLNEVETINIIYEFVNNLPEKATPNYNWYRWEITQKLNFRERSHISILLEKERNVWVNFEHHIFLNYFWIHLLVLMLSVISLYYHWQYIIAVAKVYDRLRSRFEKKHKSNNKFRGLQKERAKIDAKNKKYKRTMSGLGLNDKKGQYAPPANAQNESEEKSVVGKC